MRRTLCIVPALVLIGSLARGADPQTVERHLEDLQSPLAAVRAAAAGALGEIGSDRAVDPLLKTLAAEQPAVRRAAARALGMIRDARAVPPLVKALGDADVNVRFYAAYALGEIKDTGSVEPLIESLRDPQWCVRDQAAWALREINDPKILRPLIAELQRPGADVPHVKWLLHHVGGTQLAGILTELLKATNPQTRVLAVRWLGELQPDTATEPLLAAFDDRDPEVRRAAVESLSAVAGDRAEEPLERLAAREQNPAVQEALEKALRRFSPEATLAAHWSFDDGNPKVAKDATGRGSDGQILGCSYVAGKSGRALQFGKGCYIELGKPAALPIGNRPFTVMAWVKSDAPQGVVVARGGAYCGYSLYIKDGCARFGIHREQEGPTYLAKGKRKIVGAWTHLAGVVKADRIELYVDGKLAATAETDGYIPGNCGQGMEIGFDTGNSPAEITDALEGIIDEVRIYEAALSEKQISKLGQ